MTTARPMGSPADVELVEPDAALFRRLLPVARQIFTDTFARDFDEAPFARFCNDVYLPGGSMERDFATPNVRWRVATCEGAPIGYVKLTPLRAPAPAPMRGAVEMQQLYVLPDWHGAGIADRLMRWALAEARALDAPEIYLTVFDHNERAKRFYARYGFAEVGRCVFQLGGRIEDDRVWRTCLG